MLRISSSSGALFLLLQRKFSRPPSVASVVNDVVRGYVLDRPERQRRSAIEVTTASSVHDALDPRNANRSRHDGLVTPAPSVSESQSRSQGHTKSGVVLRLRTIVTCETNERASTVESRHGRNFLVSAMQCSGDHAVGTVAVGTRTATPGASAGAPSLNAVPWQLVIKDGPPVPEHPSGVGSWRLGSWRTALFRCSAELTLSSMRSASEGEFHAHSPSCMGIVASNVPSRKVSQGDGGDSGCRTSRLFSKKADASLRAPTADARVKSNTGYLVLLSSLA